MSRFTADGAYDTIPIYEAAGARGATVVVPPTKTAAVSRRTFEGEIVSGTNEPLHTWDVFYWTPQSLRAIR